MWIRYNANPVHNRTGDCVVRAIATVMNVPWMEVHDELCDLSSAMYDMPSSNEVWMRYLDLNGYRRVSVENTCPHCNTVAKFAEEHPYGEYILSTCEYSVANDNHVIATGSHVVALINGDWYDTWDSSNDVILYYWY